MRAVFRTAASIAGVIILAASSAACSNENPDGPSLTTLPATSSAAAPSTETDTSAGDGSSSAATTNADKSGDATDAAKDNSQNQNGKKDEKNATDESGYSYDRVKNSDGYFIEVGLGEAGQKASFPSCDGRYILILTSVIDEGDEGKTFSNLAKAVMLDGPSGKEFTVPGQCGSLRKSVHGNLIYPVYLDFGSDQTAACRAKAAYGGNVRPLTNDSFPDASNSDVDDARLALDPC